MAARSAMRLYASTRLGLCLLVALLGTLAASHDDDDHSEGSFSYLSGLFARSTAALQEKLSIYSSWFWIYVAICVGLVAFAGLMSGLTTGLMSLDPVRLRILSTEGTEVEQLRAEKVLSLIHHHHLLLVTLLLANATCMEALPLFLDALVPSWMAVVLSVTAILIFGEVLPQALCTGPSQLAIAYYTAPIVKTMLVIFWCISWPIARLLDTLLGDHSEEEGFYARSHLKALIRMHGLDNRGTQRKQSDPHAQAPEDIRDQIMMDDVLGRDEVIVIEGALDLAAKTVVEVMVPFEDIYMLEMKTRLTPAVLTELLERGHSRVLVYSETRNNVQGILLVKSLITVDPKEGRLVSEFVCHAPLVASPQASLYDMLNEFQCGRSHIAIVTELVEEYASALANHRAVDRNATFIGIVTLEDVIEELIQEEILDEFDSSRKAALLRFPPREKEARPLRTSKDETPTPSRTSGAEADRTPAGTSVSGRSPAYTRGGSWNAYALHVGGGTPSSKRHPSDTGPYRHGVSTQPPSAVEGPTFHMLRSPGLSQQRRIVTTVGGEPTSTGKGYYPPPLPPIPGQKPSRGQLVKNPEGPYPENSTDPQRWLGFLTRRARAGASPGRKRGGNVTHDDLSSLGGVSSSRGGVDEGPPGVECPEGALLFTDESDQTPSPQPSAPTDAESGGRGRGRGTGIGKDDGKATDGWAYRRLDP